MKKLPALALSAALCLSVLAGCGSSAGSSPQGNAPSGNAGALKKITVGASVTPHAEILQVAKGILAKQGYDLEIKEFTDYVQPNLALQNKELDANYFQHKPYLDDFNKQHGTNLVPIGAVHYEPLAIYPGKTKKLSGLANGATVSVPNDTTNEARALLLLQTQGLIKLKDGANLLATVNDIAKNPKNLKISEIESAQLARSLADVDIAVINMNYALQAGLSIKTDALASEDAASLAAQTYANIVAVRAGDENREDLKALMTALHSDEVRQFIETKYNGAVVPLF